MDDKPSENNNQLINERKQLIEKITLIHNNFKEEFNKIEDNFIQQYNTYAEKLVQKINNYDAKIGTDIESEQLKNDYYRQTNKLLSKILENKIIGYKEYITEITNITQKFLEKSIKDNMSETDSIIEELIQKKQMEKKKEEEITPKPEEEVIKPIRSGLNIKKTVKEISINDTTKIVPENLEENKLIIKDIKKEHFESIFKKTVDFPERSKSLVIESGDPAPGAFSHLSHKNTICINKKTRVKNKALSDVIIMDSTLEDINFSDYFSDLKKLKIINTKLSFNLAEKINFEQLESLKLENVGLINENFNVLFEQLRKNKEMRNNLRVFSVKKNNISFLDYKKGYADNILKTMTFKKLEILDMSYNKLYLFQNQIFNCLEVIKLIDLTNNNIAFPTNLNDLYKAAKSKKCLVLLTDNLAILKKKPNVEYNQYLIQIMQEIPYEIKNITLNNIFCGKNFKDIFQINLGKFKNSLVHLNLSNGLLKDDNLIELFSKDWDFQNLKSLVLESNKLTEKFLYALTTSDNSLNTKFLKLKVLNLSDNQINLIDVDKFKNILTTFKNLLIFELKCTPFEQCINQYYRKKVMKFHDPNNKMIREHTLNANEEKILQIIENKIIQDNSKAKIIIMDLIGVKYTKTLFIHLLNLVERITLYSR